MHRANKLLLGLVIASSFAMLLAPATARAQDIGKQEQSGKRRIRGGGEPVTLTISVQDRSLRTVMEFIAKNAGINIDVDEEIDKRISLELHDVEWHHAMDLAAEKGGCIVVELAANLFKIEKPPRVHFAFENADISEVINTIAKLSGANIIFDSQVQGTITMRLKDIPWRDALDKAVKQLGYVVVEEDRGILRIVHSSRLKAELETRSYQLRYLSPASTYTPKIESEFISGSLPGAKGQGKGAAGGIANFDVLKALEKALTADGRLEYISSKNVIIVTDTRPVLDSIEKLLQKMDIEPRQVYVDVKFISTVNTDVFDFGMDYGPQGPQASVSMGAIPISLPFILGKGGFEDSIIVTNPGTGGPQQPDPQGGGSGPYPGGASPGVIPPTVYGMLDFTGVSAALRLIKSDVKAKIIQAPRIIALDRQPATIFVGEEIRYAEAKTEQGQAGGNELSVKEASNSPVNTGFQLMMFPQIVPGTNQVILEIVPKQNALSGSGGTGAPPGFDVFQVGASDQKGSIALPRVQSSELMTRMLVDSGQTAVIGGLTTDTDTEIVRKVPLLGDIPILGWLFKFSSTSKDRRSLIVLITPNIISSAEETQGFFEDELNRRREQMRKEFDELYGADPAQTSAQGSTLQRP